MEFHYAPGATPLDPDEAAGLVPTHITTQADMNAWFALFAYELGMIR